MLFLIGSKKKLNEFSFFLCTKCDETGVCLSLVRETVETCPVLRRVSKKLKRKRFKEFIN